MYAPVSLHREPGDQARGNLIGQMTVSLPIGIADPVVRLRAISRETGGRKTIRRPSLGSMTRGMAGRADAEGCPDIDIFARGAQEELHALVGVVRPLRAG